MDGHTDILFFLHSADQQNTSCCRAEVNRAQSPVGAACTRSLVQMTNQHDGTASPLRNRRNIFQNGADLVSTVHIHLTAQVTLNRIQNQKPCAGLHNGSFDPFVQQSQRMRTFHDVQDPVDLRPLPSAGA